MKEKAERTNKQSFQQTYGIDFQAFFAMVRMLTQDTLKLDWKARRKETLIKVISWVALFIGLSFLFKVFYQLAMTLNIFSILPFVPLAVPSIVSSIIFVLGFIHVLGEVTDTLYFAPDIKVMATFPANGLTVFMARLFTVFIKEFINCLLVEIPFLFGYILNSSLPVFMIFQIVITWALYVSFELLVATLLSVGVFYIKRFFHQHKISSYCFFLVLLVGGIWLVSYFLSLIPEHIDIFTNWGPYFARIQEVLTYYRDHFSFFYGMTQLSCGTIDGYSTQLFEGNSLLTLLVILAATLILLVLDVFIVNPIYLKMATKEERIGSLASRLKEPKRRLTFPEAQLRKELISYTQDTSILTSFALPLILLPVITMLMSKVFGAMSTDTMGDILVNCVMLLLILLISLNTVSALNNVFSQEGKAYSLSRSFPVKEGYLLGSKLFIPTILTIISCTVSGIVFGQIKRLETMNTFYFCLGIIFFSVGQLFFASGMDIQGQRDNFDNDKKKRQNSLIATVVSFVVSFAIAVLYFLFLRERIDFISEMKVAGFGLLYCVFNVGVFFKKAKYIYRKGN